MRLTLLVSLVGVCLSYPVEEEEEVDNSGFMQDIHFGGLMGHRTGVPEGPQGRQDLGPSPGFSIPFRPDFSFTEFGSSFGESAFPQFLSQLGSQGSLGQESTFARETQEERFGPPNIPSIPIKRESPVEEYQPQEHQREHHRPGHRRPHQQFQVFSPHSQRKESRTQDFPKPKFHMDFEPVRYQQEQEPQPPTFQPQPPTFQPQPPTYHPETPTYQPETPSFQPPQHIEKFEVPSPTPETDLESPVPTFLPEQPSPTHTPEYPEYVKPGRPTKKPVPHIYQKKNYRDPLKVLSSPKGLHPLIRAKPRPKQYRPQYRHSNPRPGKMEITEIRRPEQVFDNDQEIVTISPDIARFNNKQNSFNVRVAASFNPAPSVSRSGPASVARRRGLVHLPRLVLPGIPARQRTL